MTDHSLHSIYKEFVKLHPNHDAFILRDVIVTNQPSGAEGWFSWYEGQTVWHHCALYEDKKYINGILDSDQFELIFDFLAFIRNDVNNRSVSSVG